MCLILILTRAMSTLLYNHTLENRVLVKKGTVFTIYTKSTMFIQN